MYKEFDNLKRYLTSLENQTSSSSKDYLLSFVQKIQHVDLIKLLRIAEENTSHFLYWNKPSFDNAFLAVDVLESVKAYGYDRTIETEEIVAKLKSNFHSNWDQFKNDSFPLFVGAMKFAVDENNDLWSEFADSDWFIPRLTIFESGTEYYLIYNCWYNKSKIDVLLKEFDQTFTKIFFQEPIDDDKRFVVKEVNDGDESEKFEWIEKVNLALQNIEDGDFQKIVLSRRVHVKFNEVGNISCFMNRLKEKYPHCYNFAYRHNDSTFFGATPEKLARIFDGFIEADALAGSIPRGKNDVEDAKLAQKLLNSEKNLAEQNTVVRFIVDSFNQFANDLDYSDTPIIRKLSNIQHLWTPIRGKLRKESTVFSILKTIHPTPAICGAPWSEALTSIRTMEAHDRGLFAGIIGWFNFNQMGDFGVAIRSAILKEKDLYAYAGCGIVKGSDPDSEYEETRLKLRPILSLLEDEKIYQS